MRKKNKYLNVYNIKITLLILLFLFCGRAIYLCCLWEDNRRGKIEPCFSTLTYIQWEFYRDFSQMEHLSSVLMYKNTHIPYLWPPACDFIRDVSIKLNGIITMQILPSWHFGVVYCVILNILNNRMWLCVVMLLCFGIKPYDTTVSACNANGYIWPHKRIFVMSFKIYATVDCYKVRLNALNLEQNLNKYGQ